MAIAWRLRNRNWQNSKNSWPILTKARAQGLAAVDSGMAGKAIPEATTNGCDEGPRQ